MSDEQPGPYTAPMQVMRLGRQPYDDFEARMRAFTDARGPDTEDQLWLVEHDPVFTQGVAGRPEHVLGAGASAVQFAAPVLRGCSRSSSNSCSLLTENLIVPAIAHAGRRGQQRASRRQRRNSRRSRRCVAGTRRPWATCTGSVAVLLSQ